MAGSILDMPSIGKKSITEEEIQKCPRRGCAYDEANYRQWAFRMSIQSNKDLVWLYLTAVDRNPRDESGGPLISGGRFQCERGVNGLVMGCGNLGWIDHKKPRWLVLRSEGAEHKGAVARLFTGDILFDGDFAGATAYLVSHGGQNLPIVGRVRRGKDHAIMSVGGMGKISAGDYSCLSGGHSCELDAGVGAQIAAAASSSIHGDDFSRSVSGEMARIRMGRHSMVVAGVASEVRGGEGSVVLAGGDSYVEVGPEGRAMIDGAGRIDLGEGAVGVGRSMTYFRGKPRAYFIVFDAVKGGVPAVAVAIVGLDGIEPDSWYRYSNGGFRREDP